MNFFTQETVLVDVYALSLPLISFFFFNDPAPPEIYTLSLHDALPIYTWQRRGLATMLARQLLEYARLRGYVRVTVDRKSTRLNSSHQIISYAVFCLKKKKIAW